MIMSFGPAFQAKDDQLGKWTVQIADWLDELGVSSNEPSPWSAHSACANLSQRVKSMLDAVVWAKLGKPAKRMSFQQKQQALLHVYVDVSQNPCRRPFSNSQDVCGTMTTSSLFYSFARDDLVLPFEMLLWHGHSRALVVPAGVTGSQIKSLAGEGMSLPCLGTCLWTGLLSRFGPQQARKPT